MPLVLSAPPRAHNNSQGLLKNYWLSQWIKRITLRGDLCFSCVWISMHCVAPREEPGSKGGRVTTTIPNTSVCQPLFFVFILMSKLLLFVYVEWKDGKMKMPKNSSQFCRQVIGPVQPAPALVFLSTWTLGLVMCLFYHNIAKQDLDFLNCNNYEENYLELSKNGWVLGSLWKMAMASGSW